MRKSDGQLAAWIHVAKQHFGRSRTTFLAREPTLQNRRHILRDVADRKRTAIAEDYDRRRSGCHNCLHQVVLRAKQIERIPIAEVTLAPGLAISALVFAYNNNRHIGLVRGFGRFLNGSSLSGWI